MAVQNKVLLRGQKAGT